MANLGYLQIIRICNQNCIFCSNPENNRIMPVEEAYKIVDDFIKRNYDGIILTGGEPTLYPHLEKVIKYCVDKNISVRMISNGQKLANFDFFKKLVDAGLSHVHISIYSYKEEIQKFLTGNEKSLKNILKALNNAGKLGITVDINTTINHYNARHLDKNVIFLLKHFPFIHHFVWNNLDPTTDRVLKHPEVVAQLWEFEVSLFKAVKILEKYGKTFRIERVPLCYMPGFEYASTETRKIVKNEERIVHFLDEKGMVRQKLFRHGKTKACSVCKLDSICAGLFEMDTYYKSEALYPVFKDPQPIIDKILNHD